MSNKSCTRTLYRQQNGPAASTAIASQTWLRGTMRAEDFVIFMVAFQAREESNG